MENHTQLLGQLEKLNLGTGSDQEENTLVESESYEPRISPQQRWICHSCDGAGLGERCPDCEHLMCAQCKPMFPATEVAEASHSQPPVSSYLVWYCCYCGDGPLKCGTTCVCKHEACKECPVETEKEPNIESDITTWCLVGIPYKESDMSDIKTWYCCQCRARHGPVEGPIEVCECTHLHCSRCEYEFRQGGD